MNSNRQNPFRLERELLILAGIISFFQQFAVAQPPPGTVRWTFDLPPPVYSAPCLADDGTVYLVTSIGLHAITNSGTAASNRWIFPVPGERSASIAPDGTIYYGDSTTLAALHAVNPDGSAKWQVAFQPGVNEKISFRSCSAIGADGSIYAVAGNRLYAVTSQGLRKWERNIFSSYSEPLSPIVSPNGTILVGAWCFNPDGGTNWFLAGEDYGRGESAAVDADGTVYLSEGGRLAAVNPTDQIVWSTTGPDFRYASPVLGVDGTVYLGSYPEKSLYAFSAGGEQKWHAFSENYWKYPPPGTTPAINSKGEIFYCVSNSVVAINDRGEPQWVVSGGEPELGSYFALTSPVLGPDGTLYAVLGSTLYAIATGTNGPADSPWPMYRQNARHTGKVEKPALAPPKKRADANFDLQLFPNQLGLTYTVENSSNLVDWTALTSFVATNFPVEVPDLTATNAPARFYRAFSAP